jgi:FkbM family methyltransferase
MNGARSSAEDDLITHLSQLRNEDKERTEAFLQNLARKLVPRRLVNPQSIAALNIMESGLDWPYSYIRLESGETFYSWPSNPTQVRQFWMVRDKLPKTVNMATFGAASDAAFRYAYIDRFEPDDMTGWVVVEAGAYIGLKAIRYGKKVGRSGKVLAVEIDSFNYDLMKVNIEANGLNDVVVPILAALNAQDGESRMLSDGYQKNSVIGIDALRERSTRTVQSIAMDTLIDQHGVDRVDFINVQVNGAEADLLAGFQRHFDKLRRFHIVSRYGVEGAPIRPQVLKWLEDHHFILAGQTERAVYGNAPGFSYGAPQ